MMATLIIGSVLLSSSVYYKRRTKEVIPCIDVELKSNLFFLGETKTLKGAVFIRTRTTRRTGALAYIDPEVQICICFASFYAVVDDDCHLVLFTNRSIYPYHFFMKSELKEYELDEKTI